MKCSGKERKRLLDELTADKAVAVFRPPSPKTRLPLDIGSALDIAASLLPGSHNNDTAYVRPPRGLESTSINRSISQPVVAQQFSSSPYQQAPQHRHRQDTRILPKTSPDFFAGSVIRGRSCATPPVMTPAPVVLPALGRLAAADAGSFSDNSRDNAEQSLDFDDQRSRDSSNHRSHRSSRERGDDRRDRSHRDHRDRSRDRHRSSRHNRHHSSRHRRRRSSSDRSRSMSRHRHRHRSRSRRRDDDNRRRRDDKDRRSRHDLVVNDANLLEYLPPLPLEDNAMPPMEPPPVEPPLAPVEDHTTMSLESRIQAIFGSSPLAEDGSDNTHSSVVPSHIDVPAIPAVDNRTIGGHWNGFNTVPQPVMNEALIDNGSVNMNDSNALPLQHWNQPDPNWSNYHHPVQYDESPYGIDPSYHHGQQQLYPPPFDDRYSGGVHPPSRYDQIDSRRMMPDDVGYSNYMAPNQWSSYPNPGMLETGGTYCSPLWPVAGGGRMCGIQEPVVPDAVFEDVLDDASLQLKRVVFRDVQRRMIENTGFQSFETWWQAGKNKDNLVSSKI